MDSLGAAVLLSKFWHSSSPCIVRFQLELEVPCQYWSFKSRLLHRDSDSRIGHGPSAEASVDDDKALAIAQQPQLAKLPVKLSARPGAARRDPPSLRAGDRALASRDGVKYHGYPTSESRGGREAVLGGPGPGRSDSEST